jgi:hypothetical protein
MSLDYRLAACSLKERGAIVMIKITLSDIIGLISLIVNIIALFKRDK